MKMNRIKLQLGLALGATLLCLPVALLAAESQVKTQPEAKAERMEFWVNGKKATPEQEAEMRLDRKKREDNIKAHFGDLYYPGIRHAATSGIMINGSKVYEVFPVITLTTDTADDIRKVWDYYVDKLPALDVLDGGKVAKLKIRSSDFKMGSNPAPIGFTASYPGLNGGSDHASLQLTESDPQGTIVCHRAGESIVIKLSTRAPREANNPKFKARTSIEIIKMVSASSPSPGTVKTIAPQEAVR